MSTDDGQDRPARDAPWWASGRGPDDGLDHAEDPLAAHRAARSTPGSGVGDDATDDGIDFGRLASAAMEVLGQFGRRSFAPPHEDGQVCDACPVCVTLRAVRQARPEVISHLADATRHLSEALRALADAGTAAGEGEGPDDPGSDSE